MLQIQEPPLGTILVIDAIQVFIWWFEQETTGSTFWAYHLIKITWWSTGFPFILPSILVSTTSLAIIICINFSGGG